MDELGERLLPIVRAAGHHVDPGCLRRIMPLIRQRITLLPDVLTVADWDLGGAMRNLRPTENDWPTQDQGPQREDAVYKIQ